MSTDYHHKYLKYKNKYLALKGGMSGGGVERPNCDTLKVGDIVKFNYLIRSDKEKEYIGEFEGCKKGEGIWEDSDMFKFKKILDISSNEIVTLIKPKKYESDPDFTDHLEGNYLTLLEIDQQDIEQYKDQIKLITKNKLILMCNDARRTYYKDNIFKFDYKGQEYIGEFVECEKASGDMFTVKFNDIMNVQTSELPTLTEHIFNTYIYILDILDWEKDNYIEYRDKINEKKKKLDELIKEQNLDKNILNHAGIVCGWNRLIKTFINLLRKGAFKAYHEKDFPENQPSTMYDQWESELAFTSLPFNGLPSNFNTIQYRTLWHDTDYLPKFYKKLEKNEQNYVKNVLKLLGSKQLKQIMGNNDAITFITRLQHELYSDYDQLVLTPLGDYIFS